MVLVLFNQPKNPRLNNGSSATIINMEPKFSISPIISQLFNPETLKAPPGLKRQNPKALSPYGVPIDSYPFDAPSPPTSFTPDPSSFPGLQFLETLLWEPDIGSNSSSASCSPADAFLVEEWPSPSQSTIDVSAYCKSKAGSRRLQQLIARSQPEEIEGMISSVAPLMAELMTHKYGNYVCQSLAQSCSSNQRLKLLTAIESALPAISKNGFGTHALQTFISMASMPQEQEIYRRAFERHVLELSRHDKAGHVIQKLAVTLPRKDFIVNTIVLYPFQLSIDKLGLCLVKKCIDDQRVRDALCPHLLELAQDPFGNYAVQVLLETWGTQAYRHIVGHFAPNVVQLSMQKFSSNVLEKCMRIPELCNLLAKSITRQDHVKSMLSSNYGCYVLKAVLETGNEETVVRLRLLVKTTVPQLTNRKLRDRWSELLRL